MIKTIKFMCIVLVASGSLVIGPNASAVEIQRVSLIGDSLVKQSQDTYTNALDKAGFESVVNGVGSRAVRDGYQCRVNGVLGIYESKIHEGCKPEGILQIRLWRREGLLGDRLILALGTNDAALYPSFEVKQRLNAARAAAGDIPIHLVTVAKLTGPKSRGRVEAWNNEARAWCQSDSACQMIEWGATKWARDPGSYTGDKVHLSSRGLKHRASYIAQTLKKQVLEER